MANHPKRVAVTAAALTLALGLGACGKGDQATTVDAVSPEEAKALMFRGVDRSAATKSVQYTATSRFHMVGGTTPSVPGMAECYAASNAEETTAYGGVDNASGAAIGGPSRGVVQSVDPDFANLEDKTLYVSRDLVPDGWGVTKPWLSVEADDLFMTGLFAATGFTTAPTFTPQSSRSTPGTFEPADLLEDLRDAARSVTSAGDEDVDGVPTRHLRIELDPDKLVNPENGGTTTTTRPSGVQYDLATAEAWIDRDDRVRRLSMSISMTMTFDTRSMGSLPSMPGVSDFSMPTGAEISFDIRFFAYDEPLPLAVPTADQVQDVGDLPASVVLDGKCGLGSMTASLPSDPTTDTPEMKAYHDCIAAETRKATEGVTWREYRAQHFSSGSISSGPIPAGPSSACPYPMPDFGQLAEQIGPAFGIPMDTPEARACVEALFGSFGRPPDATSTTVPSPLTPGTAPPGCEELFSSTGPGAPWGPTGSIPTFPTVEDPQMQACTDALSRLDQNQPPPPEPPVECRGVIPPSAWSPFDSTTTTSAP